MNVGGTYVTTTSNNSTLEYDQPITFTATVTAGVIGSGTPTGTVNFFDSSTFLGSAPLESGEALLTVPILGVGNHSIVASYSGDGHFNPHAAAPFTQHILQAPTSVSFVESVGTGPTDPMTFTITVKSLTAGIPTGTGSLFGNARMSGTAPLNTAGQTALTFSCVTPGSFMVGASYSGDANYQPSVGSLMNRFSVGRYASTTILTSSTNPVTAGQSVTFTASISSACYNAGGTDFVTFKNGLATLGTASVSNGLATFTTSSLPAGADKIIATFAGDSNLLASTSNTLTETVSNFATTTTLTSSANPSTYGQNVMFTASVSATSGGAPGGTVTFKNGTQTLGTQTLSNGVATISTNVLTVGTHSITAVYGGDPNHAGSTSPALSQVVNKASTTASLVSSLNPSNSGNR